MTARKSTVLIVDDSASIRFTTRTLLALEPDLEVIEAADGLSGFRMLAEKQPGIVLCDLEMPLADGRKLLALRKSRPELDRIPVIMLTGDADPEHRADLFDLGATDFVTKPFDTRELLARMRMHLRRAQLESTLRSTTERLTAGAVTDALTGLANRRRLDEALLVEVERAKRYGSPLSVAIVDIDRFGTVEDTWGPDAGESVLRGLARTVDKGVRRTDLAARLDRDGFVVLMPHTPLDSARDVAERLRLAMRAQPHAVGSENLALTVSIGVATLDTTKGVDDGAKLLEAADGALDRAKSAGRDRVAVA